LAAEQRRTYGRRSGALQAFAEAPAKSAEDMVLKLKYLMKAWDDDEPGYRWVLTDQMIRDLRAA
jgi:hypothetical protein